MDTVTAEAFDVSSYHRQQVFAMLPERVGELSCQMLPQFLNDAVDAELTRRLARPRRYRHWTATLRRSLLIGVTWGSPPRAAIVLPTPWRAG